MFSSAVAVAGTTFDAMPPATRTALTTSRYTSPSSSTSTGSRPTIGCSPRTSSWIAFTPVHGRAECALSPWKVILACRLPRQPAWNSQSVGSSTIASSTSREQVGREERRERALADRHLFTREEEVARGYARPGELDHDGNAGLHVACPETVYRAAVDPAGEIPLRRHRVQVSREGDGAVAVQQHLAVVVHRSTRDEIAQQLDDCGLRTALGGDVDELQRPGGEIGSRHGRGHNDVR